MHRPIFGHSFAVLVAPILLSVLAFNFLNKKKGSERRNAEDADSSPSGSLTAPTETNSSGSSSSSTEINNGASSSSTANSYQVFLSFRGLDTRYNFTDHLYNGLLDAGIRAFRDDEELRQGEEIGPDLLAAIKNSKILIPILSENYGTSNWCLDELVQIMECKEDNTGTIVLPIFYKVAPADVRYQIGKFGEAFHERESHLRERGFDPTTLEEWKKALFEVGNLKGREANGSEADLVKSVVQQVLLEQKNKFELVLPENLVGIDRHVKKFMEIVDNNFHATLFVVIHGMGGIGKTTLAKTIYNKLSNQFHYRSFIDDIRESYERNGPEYLQNQLISDTLKRDYKVSNWDEGIRFISSNFKDKKVLILLDDVDNVHQLKALAGNHNWFFSGSVIIITTRNKRILDNVKVDYDYELEEMDEDTSLILFSRHAFGKDAPLCEFEDLTRDAVSATGRLPLSLEVLGSFLHNKKRGVWEDTIKKLRNVPDKEVQKRLKISFEALEYDEKQIFLDIACFFIGTDLRIASYMWDACDFYPKKGIEVLRFRSLLKVGDNHMLKMHDQLRDLGREIVREENKEEPGKRSRLWDSKEVLEVLKGNEGTKKIEAIYLRKDWSKGIVRTTDKGTYILTGKQFKELRNLRLLDVSWAELHGDFENSTKKLKWLKWKNCPSTFEAKNFHVEELRVLELRGTFLSDEWQGWSWIKMAKELKYLNLSYCRYLKRASFLSAFENLEVLILEDCCRIERIDSCIGSMKSLVHLDLTRCVKLKGLPAEVGKLEALKQLLLGGCHSISSLPDTIGDLRNLEILNIHGTGIKELPDGIGRLRKLRDLDASYCEQLRGDVPESISNLSSLQRLEFYECSEIQSLPMLPSSLIYLSVSCQSRRLPALSNLIHLKELHLCNCYSLECIPSEKSLNTPFELEILDIEGCRSMETLDISQFNHLRTLSVSLCKNLLEIRGLDKFIYLESLDTSISISIERLDFPKSKGLKKLEARFCEELVEIQGLNRLESLEEIVITRCTSIQRLDLSKSKGLKKLKARGCKKLVEIQGLDRLESLEEIDISWCTLIQRLDLSKSKGLKKLNPAGCNKLVEIQGLDRLESLEEINISWCTSLQRLDLSKSKGLKKLDAVSCDKLVEIQGLDLEEIVIRRCTSIQRLDLSKSNGLKKLEARGCDKLVEIQGLDRLESLEEIYISECTSIQRLYLSKYKGLKKLEAACCEKLVDIQGLDRLESLEEIDISECISIQRLNLSKSKGLKKLCVKSCKNLFEIQGLDKLEFLEELNMLGCTSFGRLPDLRCFDTLLKLKINCCNNLHEIQSLERFLSLTSLEIEDHKSAKLPNLSIFHNLGELLLSKCQELREIPGLEESTSLGHINISGCSSIETLPDLSLCTNLSCLAVQNCEKLTELRGLEKLEQLKDLYIDGCMSLKPIPELPITRVHRRHFRVE